MPVISYQSAARDEKSLGKSVTCAVKPNSSLQHDLLSAASNSHELLKLRGAESARLLITRMFFSLRLSALRNKKTDFRVQASLERPLALILQCDFQKSIRGQRLLQEEGWRGRREGKQFLILLSYAASMRLCTKELSQISAFEAL